LPGDKWNIVLVAEGFTAAEIGGFQGFVDDFVAEFFARPPFNEDAVACAINLYRLEVASTESGADFPDCDGDGTAATTAATYFDASYCTTSRALQFTREQTAKAPVWRGGDNPPSRDGTGVHTSLCLLIQCLARAGLSTKRRERLAEWGLDLDALAKCFCHSKVERPKDERRDAAR
jgi:hypothetical protein